MTERWHVSVLTQREVDICVAVLDTCLLLSDDAVSHLALALLCGVVERAGLRQREYVLQEWRVQVERDRG